MACLSLQEEIPILHIKEVLKDYSKYILRISERAVVGEGRNDKRCDVQRGKGTGECFADLSSHPRQNLPPKKGTHVSAKKTYTFDLDNTTTSSPHYLSC